MNTRQDFFNQAYIGLAKQGFQKSHSWGFGELESAGCMYRHGDLKCAVGHLLTDEEYEKGMEGKTLYQLVNAWNLPRLEQHQDFLDSLQCAHDFAESPEDMKTRLHNFAKTYNLTIPEVE